jgi:hypothetical protein
VKRVHENSADNRAVEKNTNLSVRTECHRFHRLHHCSVPVNHHAATVAAEVLNFLLVGSGFHHRRHLLVIP